MFLAEPSSHRERPAAPGYHQDLTSQQQNTRELAESSDDFDKSFKICVVEQPAQRSRASALIERRYAWRGYATPPLETSGASKMTVCASIDDSTVATVTAGVDADAGLYVAGLYPEVVSQLRASGHKLCEFTKLAVDESVRSQAVLGAIFHVACLYVMEVHRCTDALIEVNPRHVRFYERMLGFTRAVEGERLDPQVNARAVLLRLDLRHCAREIERLGGRRGGQAERSFYPYFFSSEKASEIVSRLRLH